MSSSRLPVPLTDEDRDLLEALRTPGTPENAAIERLVEHSFGRNTSAAAALHALVEVGRKAVVEEVMLTGYAALAAAQDDEDRAYNRAARQRSATVVESQ